MSNAETSRSPLEPHEIITSLVRLHVKKPRVGGRAQFFLRVEPVLTVKVPQEEGDRKIVIKSSSYPSDDFTKDVSYLVEDSLFPDKMWMVNSEDVQLILPENKKDDDSAHSTTLFNKVIETISSPRADFSQSFIIAGQSSGVVAMSHVDGEGVLRVNVPRMVRMLKP